MISGVVLTHNSAARIAKTLQSLRFCDEILVVDDESADTTSAIAKKAGATVYSHKLKGDFSAQRNFALARAQGDWVLFVDADECVPEALAEELKKVSTDPTIAGWYLKRQDHLWGRILTHGETSKVRLLRFAQKSAGTWKGAVHETWAVTGAVGTLHQPLDHFPHPDIAQFLADINTYSTLRAHELYARHVREPWWYIPVYPVAKFFVNYVWYQGFRDGTPGAVMALMMSFHSFLVRGKLWQLWQQKA